MARSMRKHAASGLRSSMPIYSKRLIHPELVRAFMSVLAGVSLEALMFRKRKSTSHPATWTVLQIDKLHSLAWQLRGAMLCVFPRGRRSRTTHTPL